MTRKVLWGNDLLKAQSIQLQVYNILKCYYMYPDTY